MPPPARRRLGPFVLLEGATVMSGSGNGIVTVTLPWLALERTGSAATAGVVAAATALPLLAASLFAGSIVDRMGRRRAAIVSDVASGLSVAAVPIVDHLFGLDLGWLILLAVAGACFDPAGLSAREALLPDVAAAADQRLERVNGIHEAVWGIAFLVGPGVGGVLIATVGAVTTMWAAAVGFAASAVLVWCIRLPGLQGRPPRPPGAAAGLWAETREGVRLVWQDPLLRDVGLLSLGLLATYLPLEGVLFPAWFEDQGAPEKLGLLIMAMSGGGIVGALAYAAWGDRVGRRAVFVTALLVSAAGVVAMALLPPYPVLVALAVVVGLAYGPVNPLVNLAIQTRTPEQARGRVTGLLNSVGYAAGPAGFLLVGPLIEWVGIRATFAGVGVAVLVVALAALPAPGLRAFDDEPPEPDDEPPDPPEPPESGPPRPLDGPEPSPSPPRG